MTEHLDVTESDVVLVGAGIMSMTLAVFLKELQPSLKVAMFETLEAEALESSNAWNNAGTGHAALCELNYTPMDSQGHVDDRQGAGGQCRVRSLSPALDLSGQEGRDRLSWILHPSGPAYELRQGRRQCRLPEETACGAHGPSHLRGHAVFGGQAEDQGMGPTRHGGTRTPTKSSPPPICPSAPM